MDINTVLISAVAVLISIVAYFLQRLVRTLDRIDANVSAHTTEIATIKQSIQEVPEIKDKIDLLFIDFRVLKTEHEAQKNNCHRRN
jgi:hypothetical protein